MLSLATLVLYERHGQPDIAYRVETVDQIAQGDMAGGTNGAWELRCWTPAGQRPGYGVRASELVALMSATFRVINHCLGDNTLSEIIRRFHCAGGAVIDLPCSQPLHEHLTDWSNQAGPNDVFLQARHVDIKQFQAIGNHLQQEIEAMAKVRDELFGQSASPHS